MDNPTSASTSIPTTNGHGQGYQNGQNGSEIASPSRGLENRPMRRKPFTVDEALPFSPFSSVVPFNPDIIPLPSIGLRSSVSIFSTPEDSQQGRASIEALNADATNPYQTPQRLQKTLKDLQKLLRPEENNKYNFKIGPKIASHPDSHSLKPSLSPFAQMLYDSTAVEYRTSEISTTPTMKHKIAQQKAKQVKSRTPSSARVNANQQAYNVNSTVLPDATTSKPAAQNGTPKSHQPKPKPKAQFSVVIPVPSKLSPVQPPRKQSVPSPALQTPQPILPSPRVVIPASLQPTRPAEAAEPVQPSQPAQSARLSQSPQLSDQPGSNPGLSVIIPQSSLRREEYVVVADLPDSPESPDFIPRKRRAGSDEVEENVSGVLDQREKADAAIRNLREYLQDLFEFENQLQPDTDISNNQFFVSANDGIGFSSKTQSKVDNLLKTVIKVGRYSQVPLDDLIRLQKLSEAASKDAETLDLKIDEEMGELEVETLFLHIPTAELGIKSARTSLRLMSGGREEKHLYSEDVIQSALNIFRNITDSFIIPVVELRSNGSSSTLFKLLSSRKKIINNLLTQCQRLLSLMATLAANIELSETVINSLEFVVSKLIFVENAHAEKDSVLGIGKFDALRVIAMEVLSQIFLSNPEQRSDILNDILTSLEKLPVTKQSARQFKLAEGGSIQLVSALIMKLVQTSASKTDDAKEKRRRKAADVLNGDDEDPDQANGNIDDHRTRYDTESRAAQQNVTAIQELKDCVTPLLENAKANASFVVKFIIARAVRSTKGGDTPYRNLLDLFVEDFITCLKYTEWPAAELLLRLILYQMVALVETDKTPAPAKNMALDLLGSMGAAISDLNSHVRKSAAALEYRDDPMGQKLSRMAEESLENRIDKHELLNWKSPFHMSLDFMEDRCHSDPQLASGLAFFIAEWAAKVCTSYDEIAPDSQKLEENYGRLAYRLRMMIIDKRWFSTEHGFGAVLAGHAKLAYSLTLLTSQFCQSFERVLGNLLGAMASDQATVRSKSSKSISQLIETDPSILDQQPLVKTMILRCANDSSPQVRDSSLALIGKCIALRPVLEEELTPNILQRMNDTGVGVRKRAIKLLKDIYLNNTSREIRSLIADAMLHRVIDLDEGVQEMARSTIEDIWMIPFYKPTSADSTTAQSRLAISDHVALIIKTAQRQPGNPAVLDKVLQSILSEKKSKHADANYKVCKALVAVMFETIIDNPSAEDSDTPKAKDALNVLMIFAKSHPNLFTSGQIQLLQPYVSNVGGGEEASIYRSVVVIFRHVLPTLPKVQHSFLETVRKDLFPNITRSPKAVLDDVVACLWIISSTLKDFHNLTRMVASSLVGIRDLKNINFNDSSETEHSKKLLKLLLICGMCGKHCDLDSQHQVFKAKGFPTMKGTSVSKLMVDTFVSFASPDQPFDVRSTALDAMGMVCQSWPKNFTAVNVYTTFLQVFHEKDMDLQKTLDLQTIVMRSFREYLAIEEKRSEAGNEGTVGTGTDSTAKLGVMGGSQGDGVALDIAQRFLKEVTSISLNSQDKEALLAAQIVASINRQGLVHPKETACTLIALETSPNKQIADIAFREHQALHEKHETILEKEYMRAVQAAYNYQRDVVQDTHGAFLNPFASKLHLMIEILKISKVKNRKRFFESLCSRIDFDPAKLDIIKDLPLHLDFAQFLIENLAFFEYQSMDELLSTITKMEKVVSNAGTGIAHAIETEIFHVSMDQPLQTDENGQSNPVYPPVDPERLQKLTAISIMLSNLWEARTYLRRQYGLMNREGKVKGTTKDLNRAPTKVQGITGDKFWSEVCSRMTAYDSTEQMENQCRAFVELLNVDHDFKVSAENDEGDGPGRFSTPSDDEGATPGSGRGRKRKNSSATPGGRKKRARSSSIPRGRGRPKGSGKLQKANMEASNNDVEDGA